VDEHALQGWYPDPFGLHEQRYFSSGRPTKLVRDGRVEAYDEPTAQDVPGAYLEQQRSAIRDAAMVNYPPAPRPGVAAPKRRTGLVNSLVALIAVGAVVAFVAIEGGFSTHHRPKSNGAGSTAVNLAAFVKKSAEQTLAQETADFTVKGTGQIDGTSVDLRGNGQIDLANDSEAVTLSTSVAGTSVAESEVMTGQALYLQVDLNGQSIAQYLGGKHWVEIPLPASPTPDTTQDSPAWSMDVLKQQGARVVPLGAQSVGGLTCDEYAVTPSQEAMIAAAQQEWARLGVSNSERAAAEQQLENSTPPTITVWVDPVRQLVCQVDVYMQLSTQPRGGTAATNSIEMLMTFTHYGVPVHITAPEPSDTVSF
jgi:hypothetical protein